MIISETVESLIKLGLNLCTEDININEISTNGYSKFFTISDKYILKINNITKNWLALRSNDPGREALILKYLNDSDFWEIFDNPYFAIAREKDKYGLLINKPADILFEKEHNQEDINKKAIKSLAKMHALFWNNDDLKDLNYLLDLKGYFSVIGIWNGYKNTDQHIGKDVLSGWKKVKEIIPKDTLKFLLNFKRNSQYFIDLPKTFTHGNYNPLNFGFNGKTNKISIINFTLSGYAPCTVDLFYYIATTTWLEENYDLAISFYRNCLEKEIGPIENSLWRKFYNIGVITACYMRLWKKALDYEANQNDFKNWIKRLNKVIVEIEQM